MYVPRLRVPQIDGWFAKESITVLRADGQANVIVSSEPLDPTIDTMRYAEVQGDLLRSEFAGYQEDSYGPELVFGGRPGSFRKFRWTPPDGIPVVQLQMYYAAGGRGYTATATTPAAQFSRVEAVLLEILRGIVIVEHS